MAALKKTTTRNDGGDDESRSSSGLSYNHPPAFNGEEASYPGWAKTMHAIMHIQGTWEVVVAPVPNTRILRSEIGADDDEEEEEADEVASISSSKPKADPALQAKADRAFVYLLMALKTPELQALVDDVPMGNAHELWTRLEKHFTKRTMASKSHLQTEFHNTKQRSDEPAVQYIARIKKAVLSLRAVGVTVDQDTLQYKFINGLARPAFDMTRRVLMNDNTKSFTEVCDYVLSDEAQMKMDREEQTGGRTARTESANFAHTDKNQGLCYNCNQPGHIARKCTNEKTSVQPQGAGKGGKVRSTCSYCKKPGHTEAVCYSKHGKPDKSAGPSSSVPASSVPSGNRAQQAASLMARVETGLMATVERTSNPATEPATVPVLEPVPETVPPETASTRLATIPTSVPPTTPSTTVHPSVHRALKAQVEPTTCTAVPEKGLTWILDSGASQHMATSRVPLTNAIANNDVRIRVANGEALTSPMEGAITLRTAHSDRKLHLKTVLGHASMHGNLMSVSTLCKSKDVKGVLYTEDKAQVLFQDGGVLMEAHVLNGLYIIDDVFVVDPNWNQPDHSNRNQPDHDALLASTQVELELQEYMLWHARLAHLSHSGMDKLLSANVVDGLDGLKVRDVHATKHSDELCVGCITGKAHRTAFSKTPSERTKATRLLGRIHADECGPMQVASGDMGALYMLLLIDEYSRKAYGFFLKKKSDAATKIMEWCTSVSAYHNLSIGEFHTDGGGEFASTELLQFFKDRGITVTTTPPYTPQHNAIAERMNRTILESTRAMLLHAKAPQSLWAEAAQYAIHVRNVGGVRTDVRNTPDGIWTGKRTSVKHLRVFGCDAWMHVPAANRQKLDAKATICLFVGYNPDMTYRVLDVTTGKTHHSRDVTFAETKFTQCTALTEQELLASDGTVVNKDFYDFLQLSRFNTETELAKVKPRRMLTMALRPGHSIA